MARELTFENGRPVPHPREHELTDDDETEDDDD